ncbi:DUF7331 family protein [Halanaeroarchaeum sulfurireducens]|uniref:Uncharacterized protein n=1 Tax=Halanaeroarchaeum sulfurireducens TaxID=1604004 RepID=A0A0F7PCC1_9EURY|nr:hypothetical protein [Halanaeroarchaeum sulfurireducens]AKH97264.1 hypothetical protein HLASF_0768 [Halanaeroarchaeum sulfurireducens]ALG81666.1 hypothetical protein HLASA_0765 [Halanaeroarchaeum sulfurireducens]
MNDTARGDGRPNDEPELPEPIDRVEAHRSDDDLILVDTGNPLAWIKSDVSKRIDRLR